jgi:hypothetical protein
MDVEKPLHTPSHDQGYHSIPEPQEKRSYSDADFNAGSLRPNYGKSDFRDTFLAPDELGVSPVNSCHNVLYTYTRKAVYAFMSVVLGTIFVFVVAFLFGLCEAVVVYTINPFIRLIFVLSSPVGFLFRYFIRMFLDPCYESISLVWSRVKIDLKHVQVTSV